MDNPENSQYKYKFFENFHDVALRILVVDDKVGCGNTKIKDNENRIISICERSGSCMARNNCKLKTLRQLMGKEEYENDVLRGGIGETKNYFYWNEKEIECYYCPNVMEDFIEADSEDKLCDINAIQVLLDQNTTNKDQVGEDKVMKVKVESVGFVNDRIGKNVQLVGVRDVRTALLLLSRYKFDMLFFDYLLDKKKKDSNERDYSVQFFKFLSRQSNDSKRDDSLPPHEKMLRQLRRDVLDNRGPLDRFWIMPITGFNNTFIKELGREGVPLISHKWHVHNGADPITTPWQFLEKLNRFIELQLTGCLYEQEKLLEFLEYTGEDLKDHLGNSDTNCQCDFDDFQAFMGAEYASFMSHYGSRLVIKRDAKIGNNNDVGKSVFATYIWEHFYKKKDNKMLFALHDRMQQFYQIAASMPNDHNGILSLRESFRRLRYFIDVNRIKLKDIKRFDDAMENIATYIDKLEFTPKE